ncbi:MAG TPA: alpha/beta hydrolase [Thermoleophilaceae bacterium]
MPIAEANGQRLYYEVHGDGEPLLCVMGLGSDTLSWTLQVPAWSERYRTVVFDNRDVGRSSHADGPYEVTDMAADALALADALELDAFHLVGLSLGGAIAQEMALAAPDRVRTLTLCVTYGGAGAWGVRRGRVWGGIRRRQSFEEHVDNLILLCFSERFLENEEQAEALRTIILANPNPQPAEAFLRQLDAGSRHEARDRLGGLTMPVHVIGAERDMLVPRWKSDEIAELVPGARYTLIEGSGHAVNVEAAQELNAAVLDFVAEHAPAPA